MAHEVFVPNQICFSMLLVHRHHPCLTRGIHHFLRPMSACWLIAPFLFVVCSVPARAESHVVVHTFSHHFHHLPADLSNNRNYGIGLRNELSEETSVQLGAYRNSNHENSAYLIAEWRPLRWGGAASFGVFGGAVSGYKLPLAAGLVMQLQPLDAQGLTFRYVPKSYKSSSAVLSLEFSFSI